MAFSKSEHKRKRFKRLLKVGGNKTESRSTSKRNKENALQKWFDDKETDMYPYYFPKASFFDLFQKRCSTQDIVDKSGKGTLRKDGKKYNYQQECQITESEKECVYAKGMYCKWLDDSNKCVGRDITDSKLVMCTNMTNKKETEYSSDDVFHIKKMYEIAVIENAANAFYQIPKSKDQRQTVKKQLAIAQCMQTNSFIKIAYLLNEIRDGEPSPNQRFLNELYSNLTKSSAFMYDIHHLRMTLLPKYDGALPENQHIKWIELALYVYEVMALHFKVVLLDPKFRSHINQADTVRIICHDFEMKAEDFQLSKSEEAKYTRQITFLAFVKNLFLTVALKSLKVYWKIISFIIRNWHRLMVALLFLYGLATLFLLVNGGVLLPNVFANASAFVYSHVLSAKSLFTLNTIFLGLLCYWQPYFAFLQTNRKVGYYIGEFIADIQHYDLSISTMLKACTDAIVLVIEKFVVSNILTDCEMRFRTGNALIFYKLVQFRNWLISPLKSITFINTLSTFLMQVIPPDILVNITSLKDYIKKYWLNMKEWFMTLWNKNNLPELIFNFSLVKTLTDWFSYVFKKSNELTIMVAINKTINENPELQRYRICNFVSKFFKEAVNQYLYGFIPQFLDDFNFLDKNPNIKDAESIFLLQKILDDSSEYHPIKVHKKNIKTIEDKLFHNNDVKLSDQLKLEKAKLAILESHKDDFNYNSKTNQNEIDYAAQMSKPFQEETPFSRYVNSSNDEKLEEINEYKKSFARYFQITWFKPVGNELENLNPQNAAFENPNPNPKQNPKSKPNPNPPIKNAAEDIRGRSVAEPVFNTYQQKILMDAGIANELKTLRIRQAVLDKAYEIVDVAIKNKDETLADNFEVSHTLLKDISKELNEINGKLKSPLKEDYSKKLDELLKESDKLKAEAHKIKADQTEAHTIEEDQTESANAALEERNKQLMDEAKIIISDAKTKVNNEIAMTSLQIQGTIKNAAMDIWGRSGVMNDLKTLVTFENKIAFCIQWMTLLGALTEGYNANIRRRRSLKKKTVKKMK